MEALFATLTTNSGGVLVALTIGTVVLAVLVIVVILRHRALSRRLNHLLGNTDINAFEGALLEHYERVQTAEQTVRSLEEAHETTASVAQRSIHHVGIVRFNPFPGEIGGDQSFSIALLDGSQSGIVLTSLHARDGTRIYAKPIKEGASEYHLSNEEEQALQTALSQSS